MSNLPVSYYYNQSVAEKKDYKDFVRDLNNTTNNEIEKNAKLLNQTLLDNQVATEKAIYNNMQQIDGTLMAGFSGVSNQLSDVSRELGSMGSTMNMGFAFLNSAVQESSKAICNKLDTIHDTLAKPKYTQAKELYDRALKNYNDGFYVEALEDLHEAIDIAKYDRPLSYIIYFLMGQTYLRGISKFSNVIDLDASIEALENAKKYIYPDAEKYPEAKPLAAEICFCLGLAYHTKANDDLRNSNTSDYQKHLEEAKEVYKKSWDYSHNMLESLFNLARCKAITGDEDGTIRNLITVILKDHGYLIKAATESDFNNEFKQKLFSSLKKDLYLKTKTFFDRIESIRAEAPYSSNLTELIDKHLPDNFTEDTPPFDMLEASVCFPKILSILEEEKSAYENRQRKDEQERREEQRRIEEEKQKKQSDEQIRKEIEQKLTEIERIERKEKHRKRIRIIGRVFAVLFAIYPIIMLFYSNSISSEPDSIGGIFFIIVLFTIPFLVIFFSEGWVEGWVIKSIFLCAGVLLSIFTMRYALNHTTTNTFLDLFSIKSSFISYILSYITAMIFPKE